MNFTEDWVTHNTPNFEKCMKVLDGPHHHFLEVGCFEGRTTCWMLQNGLEKDGYITCVDTFDPYWYKGENLLEKFQANVREVKKPNQVVSTVQMDSYQGLSMLIQQKQVFDFIYIDGDHSPSGVLTDAVMAWGLLRKGGIMLFDDYEYDKEPTKVGIQGFMQGFTDKCDLVLQNYQLAVRKK